MKFLIETSQDNKLKLEFNGTQVELAQALHTVMLDNREIATAAIVALLLVRGDIKDESKK